MFFLNFGAKLRQIFGITKGQVHFFVIFFADRVEAQHA